MSASCTAGVLISTDEQTVVYLLHANEQAPPSKKFMLRTLDSTHVFVRADRIAYVNERLNARLLETVWCEEDEAVPAAPAEDEDKIGRAHD